MDKEQEKGYCVNCEYEETCTKAIGKWFGYCLNSYKPKDNTDNEEKENG